MIRIKRGVTSRKRHKKILKQAKGYLGSRSRTYRSAYQAVIKSGQYSYRDRKKKKGNFRKIWITQINAKVKEYGLSYSKFIYKIKKISLNLNRKIISDIINNEPCSFKKIISLINKKTSKNI